VTLRALSHDDLRKALPTILPDMQLNTLMNELDLAEQNFIQVKHNVSSDHPDYKRGKALIDDLNRKIDDRVDGVLLGLGAQVDSLASYVDSLSAQVEELVRQEAKGQTNIAR